MQHGKNDEKLAQLEAAARGASGMLRVAVRNCDDGRASREDLRKVMASAADLLEQALGTDRHPAES